MKLQSHVSLNLVAKCLPPLPFWLVPGSPDFGVCDLALIPSFSYHLALLVTALPTSSHLGLNTTEILAHYLLSLYVPDPASWQPAPFGLWWIFRDLWTKQFFPLVLETTCLQMNAALVRWSVKKLFLNFFISLIGGKTTRHTRPLSRELACRVENATPENGGVLIRVIYLHNVELRKSFVLFRGWFSSLPSMLWVIPYYTIRFF